ncbi:MAG: helix-turn-helix transcriptional regulator [Lentihominibacter sp.]
MITIRNKLKKRREDLRLTQDEVAEAAGIHHTYYSKIEAGNRTPAMPLWLKIGAALNIPEEELINYIKEGMKKGA